MIMDYKKKYDEALGRAKNLHKDAIAMEDSLIVKQCEVIFPELAESEDEKIRKTLLDHFKQNRDEGDYDERWNGLSYDSIITWLEKQVKQDLTWSEEDETSIAINNPEAYRIGFADGKAHAEEEMAIAWLEKQGKLKSSKWTEGDVVRHGGVLALVTNGRKVMKSNCEQITIQYPDEWVKAETKERKYFFDALEKQGKQEPTLRERYENISTSEWLKRTYDGMSCGMGEEQSQVKESSTLQHEGTHEGTSCKENDNSLTRETKFKAGDWVVFANGNVGHITSVGTHGYTFDDGDYLLHENCDKQAHLWSITDAKDGDVLSNGKMIVIFKHFEEPSYRQYIVAYVGLDIGGDIQITDDTWRLGIDKAKPATKEQRDLLFAKMKEAGYEWDADKKELKMIEQKPTWSEEDEKMLKKSINLLDEFGGDRKAIAYTLQEMACRNCADWLKTIKQRLGGEK